MSDKKEKKEEKKDKKEKKEDKKELLGDKKEKKEEKKEKKEKKEDKKDKKKEKKKETDNDTGDNEPVITDAETEALKIKKDLIKGEKKLEKKKEKEEKRKLKEEEKQKEREEKAKEKEDKRKAEKQRELRKEQRKSWLRQGGGGFSDMNDPVGMEFVEGKDGKEKKPKIAQCPEVKRRQRELEQYLLNMPIKRLRGTTWQYYDIAPASGYTETIVVLHGGGVRPEILYEHILGLAQGFRVVAPWFPEEFVEIEDYVAGIFLILRHENIKRSHFFGIGFGSVIALHYLSRHSARVLTCTLAHCTLPSEDNTRYVEKALKKMDWTAYGALRKLMAGSMVRAKDIEEHVFDLSLGEKEMWLRNFKNFGATKQAIFSRLETLYDYHAHCSYTHDSFAKWQNGKMLLIEAEDDEYFDTENNVSFKELFPEATQHCVANCGHLYSLIRGKIIVDLVLRFALDENTYMDVTSKADLSPRHSMEEEEEDFGDDEEEVAKPKKDKPKKEKKAKEEEKPKKKEEEPKKSKEDEEPKKEKKVKEDEPKKEKKSKEDEEPKKSKEDEKPKKEKKAKEDEKPKKKEDELKKDESREGRKKRDRSSSRISKSRSDKTH